MIITSFAVEEMGVLNKISIAIKYSKAFGKPSRTSLKEKASKNKIETLFVKNGFKISKSKVLGDEVKAIYINYIIE